MVKPADIPTMLVSLERMAIGFAFGAAAAIALALVARLSRLGENAVDPLLQTQPGTGLVPLVWQPGVLIQDHAHHPRR